MDVLSASNRVNIYYYMNKHLKPRGYTPYQITAGLKSGKMIHIMFTLVLDSFGIN